MKKSMKLPGSMVMVIFGASGDLTRRKLIPALYLLFKNKRLPRVFAVLGIGRTDYSDTSFRELMGKELRKFVNEKEVEEDSLRNFVELLYYQPMDPADSAQYPALKERLDQLDGKIGSKGNYLFYLATPPSLYGVIPVCLKEVRLNVDENRQRIRRIIVEKPFGYDLESARELNEIYQSVFSEDQIFRIDHFLGKETVQNILALRFANSIFEPLWNRNYVEYVEVTAVENLGIEQRGGFYDHTGALRDMVQNHLIQLVAITAMEPPTAFNADSFRNEVVKVYQSLAPLTEKEMRERIVRGQYMASDDRKGYREEYNVDPGSRTETFLAMSLKIDNWRWSGVPFYIRTGKQMPTKVTEIIVHFKKVPFSMFQCKGEKCPPADRLIIRIQPNEGVVLRFAMKVPGSGFEVKMVDMDFSYGDLGGLPAEDAYSRLIEDCMLGDSTLFTRSDAVEASWTFFDPVLKYWKEHPDIPLYGYPAGTWGPEESETMVGEHGAAWVNPCKNLTNTHLYCEL